MKQIYLDIHHLTSRAYLNTDISTPDVIARDFFLDAMSDVATALKITELNVLTLDEAYEQAVRLQVIYEHTNVQKSDDDTPKCLKVQDSATQQSCDTTLELLQQRISLLEYQLQSHKCQADARCTIGNYRNKQYFRQGWPRQRFPQHSLTIISLTNKSLHMQII